LRYSEFLERSFFEKNELIANSLGRLVEDPPAGGIAKLPAPPFLMIDRITSITRNNRSGKLIAEQDVNFDAWFFQCHFVGDPVQPGCLGVDAVWQLLGFYCAASGAEGTGRALGAKEIEFTGQIRPFNKVIRYELDIRRFSILKEAGSAIAIADGLVFVDGQQIYSVKDAKVGIFKEIEYKDYPNPNSRFAVGGLIQK
jgi:3-hydroxyacyl-[acyl-carrier protein] dehydratase / trans-2-decenoyl-[acyl-carrier protein] isomerase